MSSTAENNSTFDLILSKFGLILSNVKDAIFKDFLDGLVKDGSYEDFLAKCKNTNVKALEEFFDAVFKKIGYDISKADKSSGVYKLIQSIFDASTELSQKITELFNSSELTSLKGIVCSDKPVRLDDLGRIGSDIASGKFGDDVKTDKDDILNRLKAIIKLVQVLFDLFKQFSNIEWEGIAAEGSDFGKFIKDSYFTEKFAKRIADYVLITFLKNARDVFADDLELLLEQKAEDVLKSLQTVAGFDAEKFNKLLEEFKGYKKQLGDVNRLLENKINEVKQIADNSGNGKSAKKLKKVSSKSVVDDVKIEVEKEFEGFTKGQLESYKKILRQKIDALLDQIAPEYTATAKVLSRTHAVLEFLGVIGTKKVDLLSYAGKSINNVVNVEPIEIPSFHWNRVEKLFTKPADYLQEVFPVKDHKDLENVLIKVVNLVHAFNKDFPQFDSIKQMLWDLVLRISDKIAPMEAEASEAYKVIKDKYEFIRQYLIDLLKVCEAFAIETKETLELEFKNLVDDSKDIGKSLQHTWEELSFFDKNVKDKLSLVVTDELKNIIKETFEAAAKEKFSEFCNETEIEKIAGEITSKANDLGACSVTFYNSVKNDIENLFDVNTWKAHVSEMVNELNNEFINQTANFPNNLKELKDFGTGTLDDLLALKTPTNPFSDFDPTAFFKIIVDKLSCPVDVNFKSYYDKFKDEFDEKLNGNDGFVKSLLAAVEQSGQNADILTSDLLQCWWNKIQERFEKVFLDPSIDSLKDDVVLWIIKVLGNIIDGVKSLIKSPSNSKPATAVKLAKSAKLTKSVQSAQGALVDEPSSGGLFDNISDIDIDAIGKIIEEIIDWEDFDADSWTSWQNAIKLAVNIYKVIPAEIKQYVSEIIDFPDLSAIEEYLPEYSFDAKNKFLAVTVLDKKIEEKDKTYAGEVGINIQLLIFIGEKKKENAENKDDETKDEAPKDIPQGEEVKQDEGAEKEKADSEKKDEKNEGIFILPVIKGKFTTNFNVGEKHCMSFSATPSLNASVKKPGEDEKGETKSEGKTEGGSPKTDVEEKGKDGAVKKDDNKTISNALGCFIKLTDKISETSVEWLDDVKAISANAELKFQRGQVGEKGDIEPIHDKDDSKKIEQVSIFDTQIASLSIENYPQTFFVGYKDSKFDIGYSCELQKLLLALKLKDQNDFFKAILKKDVEIELEKLKLQYSLQKGFEVEDSLKVRIPINADIDLDVVKFKNLAIDLGLDGNDLQASLKTSFIADLKGVTITFTDMGLGVDCKLPFNGQKDFDISPKFTYPNGLGISIDVEGVTGGGAIQWEEERERFFGGLELTVVDKFSARAMLVFTTGKGTDPFSLMAALCVYFDPGIQLGMGFSLEGIGGSFGYNRMLCVDSLRDSVYDGTLESALFFKDVTKNVDKVLANIDKFYPIKIGQMYFGFLGKIAWGTILKADFGLFIQAPNPVTIIIAGVVKVSVSESSDKLLVINACFMGGIQFDKGIFFDASLYDSKIVGLELYGDMALRIYWGGETKGFILSVGGFHPEYKPEAGFNLPDLRRVGLKLDYKILKMSLEAYFAITSNTVQFGTSLDLRIGWDKFGLIGYAAFNALFQFKPFKFVVDMKAGLAVKMGSKKICSIDLAFELGGPAQWHAKGKASVSILFIKISVHFDQTWGKKQIASDRKRIDILPIFKDEFRQKGNWKFISSDLTDNMVSLVQFDENSFVLQPSDTISFNQSAVPLDTDIQCYGEDNVNDVRKISIDSVKIGDDKMDIESEESSFAPSLTSRLDEDKKLSEPSFVSKHGGFKLTAVAGVKKGSSCKKEIDYTANYSLIPEVDDVQKNLENYQASLKKWKNIVADMDGVHSIAELLHNASKNNETKAAIGGTSEIKEKNSSNVKYKKVSRGSSRRTASGFNRFINQWDEYWNEQIKNISKVK